MCSGEATRFKQELGAGCGSLLSWSCHDDPVEGCLLAVMW